MCAGCQGVEVTVYRVEHRHTRNVFTLQYITALAEEPYASDESSRATSTKRSIVTTTSAFVVGTACVSKKQATILYC